MKKIFALSLALLALLSVLSGCGAQTAAPTETTEATEATEPKPLGTLYVSFGAALEIRYDKNGNALEMVGVNEAGKVLAEAKQDQLNKGCVYTLRSVLRYAIENSLLGDAKTVAIRVGAEHRLPKNEFLDEIAQDCQYLIDEELAGLEMVSLVEERLDDLGDLRYETAKLLAEKYLDSTDVSGEELAVGGVYTFTAGERSCTVDAFTGLVVGK